MRNPLAPLALLGAGFKSGAVAIGLVVVEGRAHEIDRGSIRFWALKEILYIGTDGMMLGAESAITSIDSWSGR